MEYQALLQDLMGSWGQTGLVLSRPEPLHGGGTHQLFCVLVRRLGEEAAFEAVLKAGPLGGRRAGLHAEAAALRRLQSAGCTFVPKVLGLRCAGRRGGLLLELLPGGRPEGPNGYRFVGALLARLHSAAASDCGPAAAADGFLPAAWMEDRAATAGGLLGKMGRGGETLPALLTGSRWADSLREIDRLKPAWCHGDPGIHNLLVDGDRSWLIDFGQAHRHVGEADLAHILTRVISPLHAAARDWAVATAVLDGYRGAGGSIEPGFSRRVDSYMMVHWLETAAGLLQHQAPAASGGSWARDVLPIVKRRLHAHRQGEMARLLLGAADELFAVD